MNLIRDLRTWWKRKRARSEAVAKFMKEHGPALKAMRYSPLDGERLIIKVIVSEKAPFDPRTGVGIQDVDVRISTPDSYYANYRYDYREAERAIYYESNRGYSGWKRLPEG